MTQEFKPGDKVVVAWRVGEIMRKARMGRVDGYNVLTLDRDSSEGSLPHFTPDYLIKPAVVGVTICAQSRGTHWCGLIHVADPSQYPTKGE